MIKLFEQYTKHKKVLILGYGREGRSSHNFIKKYFPELFIGIADQNKPTHREIKSENHNFHTGVNYLESVKDYDVIIKSPGVNLPGELKNENDKTWLSQTGLFLECFRDQIIGITGTKGKSTTSSLIYHLLKSANRDTVLVGNIGKPPFDLLSDIQDETTIVFELSANQLENVKHSPHIAVLLNLFPEHLDYFGEVQNYYRAKMNICRFQMPDDVFLYDNNNREIQQQLKFLDFVSGNFPIDVESENNSVVFENDEVKDFFNYAKLKGDHNRKNILAASSAAKYLGVVADHILAGIKTFNPLSHRLEYVGNFCGIDFYNDSISTIPESTIEAVKTIKNVSMLILGGFDRGISYQGLIGFLAESTIKYFAFTGPAGMRLMHEFELHSKPGQTLHFFESFENIADWFGKVGMRNACLLSPAAPSYDAFRDFEERGNVYKKMAENFAISCQ